MSNADWTTAIATCFIAIAALANVYVYYGMWKQTSDLFRESYKPRLSVAIQAMQIFESDGRLKGRIVTTNHGDAVANGINLRIRFGYSNFTKGYYSCIDSASEQARIYLRSANDIGRIRTRTNDWK